MLREFQILFRIHPTVKFLEGRNVISFDVSFDQRVSIHRYGLDFGGDPRDYSIMHQLIIHKISGHSIQQWITNHINRYWQLIFENLSSGAIKETINEYGEVVDVQQILHHFDYETIHPFGFLDDFAIRTTNVRNSPSQHSMFQHDNQRAFYSGHLKKYGLKAQYVLLPIGIIALVFLA